MRRQFPGKPFRIACVVLLVMMTVFCAAICVWGAKYFTESPFRSSLVFSETSVASSGDDGSLVVVDLSKRRVSVLAPDFKVTTVIRGGTRSGDGFFSAEYAVVYKGRIYISDVLYALSGTQVEAERIMRFSMAGAYEATVFEKHYSQPEMPLYLGYISSLRAGGMLTFLLKGDNELSLYSIEGDGAVFLRSVDNVPNIRHTLYSEAAGTILVSTKEGVLYEEADGAFTEIKSWTDSTGERIYWDLAASAGGVCFATDIGGNLIARLDDDSVVVDCSLLSEDAVVMRLSIMARRSHTQDTTRYTSPEQTASCCLPQRTPNIQQSILQLDLLSGYQPHSSLR